MHRRRLSALATAAVAAILSLASAAAAARSDSVTDLGDLGGGSTHPKAINDAGMVTGGSTRVDHPLRLAGVGWLNGEKRHGFLLTPLD